jgi:hypothetical protein
MIEGGAEQEKTELKEQIDKNSSHLLGVLAGLDGRDHTVDD